MELAALLLAAAALLVALGALLGARSARLAAEDAARDSRRRSSSAEEEVQAALALQRALLARVARGEPVDADMIEEGRLWRELDARAARRLLEEAPDAIIVDVREADELSAGVLPGALHVPVDQIPERKGEIPRSASAVLVYCAAGARSAAACEYLAREGWQGLHNLAGGFGSWDGPIEPRTADRP